MQKRFESFIDFLHFLTRFDVMKEKKNKGPKLMCGYCARKRVRFKELGAKTNLSMGIIMINHVRRTNPSQRLRIHLGYLTRHTGCVDWLVYGRQNDKWLVMLKPVHRLAVSGERLHSSKDCWERSSWLAFWLRMSDRTDDTRQRKWQDSSTGRVFAVIRGWLEDGGPLTQRWTTIIHLLSRCATLISSFFFFFFYSWPDQKPNYLEVPRLSAPPTPSPSPLLGRGWVL